MQFIVRITADDTSVDLKAFELFKDANDHFMRALVLLKEESHDSVFDDSKPNMQLINRLRKYFGLAFLERVELFQSDANNPLDGANSVRQGSAALLRWASSEDLIGNMLD